MKVSFGQLGPAPQHNLRFYTFEWPDAFGLPVVGDEVSIHTASLELFMRSSSSADDRPTPEWIEGFVERRWFIREPREGTPEWAAPHIYLTPERG
jgi:hypothetical protein